MGVGDGGQRTTPPPPPRVALEDRLDLLREGFGGWQILGCPCMSLQAPYRPGARTFRFLTRGHRAAARG